MLVQRRPRNPLLIVLLGFAIAIGVLLVTSLLFAFVIPPEFSGYSIFGAPVGMILLTVVVCMITGN